MNTESNFNTVFAEYMTKNNTANYYEIEIGDNGAPIFLSHN